MRSERVLAFAEVMAANLPLGIHEVVRRPEPIVEGLPDREVAVQRHGILDVELFHRRAHVGGVLLERELGRVHTQHDQSRILVVPIPGIHVWHGAQAVDA